MAEGSVQPSFNSEENEKIFVTCSRTTIESIEHAQADSDIEYRIFFSVADRQLAKFHPCDLKNDLTSHVSLHESIKHVKQTRNGKLLIVTKDKDCAKELLQLSAILHTRVTPSIQMEGLASRFVLQSIPDSLSLIELAQELEASNALKVK